MEWQDISTAPRDDSELLLINIKTNDYVVARYQEFMDGDRAGCLLTGHFTDVNPLHTGCLYLYHQPTARGLV